VWNSPYPVVEWYFPLLMILRYIIECLELGNNCIVFEVLSAVNLLQIEITWPRVAEPVKQILATIKPTIYGGNTSNTILLFSNLTKFSQR